MKRSDNVRDLQPSATIAVATRARELRAQGRDIVDLSAGEPDFDTPAFVSEAGIQAIRAGHTRYTPAAGLLSLRKAIAADLGTRTGRTVDPAGLVVTAGAKQALFNACFVLFGPGDRVLIPSPYWTSYPELVRLARAEPVEVTGAEENDFKVTPRELDGAADAGARGLILNSPSNPTGAVYGRPELEAILRWAAERGVWVISDEIYGRISYVGDRAPGLLDLEPGLLERTVLIDGASKAYAMTGWRIGFSYSDPELAGLMAALQSHTTSNATTPAQHAAIAAYSDPRRDGAVHEMARVFRGRRDLVVSLFRELLPDVPFVEPEGAFYLFFRTDGFYDEAVPDSVGLCRQLLEEAGVALVPGIAFGDDRFVRLSFATSEDVLADGIRRLARVLRAGAVPHGV